MSDISRYQPSFWKNIPLMHTSVMLDWAADLPFQSTLIIWLHGPQTLSAGKWPAKFHESTDPCYDWEFHGNTDINYMSLRSVLTYMCWRASASAHKEPLKGHNLACSLPIRREHGKSRPGFTDYGTYLIRVSHLLPARSRQSRWPSHCVTSPGAQGLLSKKAPFSSRSLTYTTACKPIQ